MAVLIISSSSKLDLVHIIFFQGCVVKIEPLPLTVGYQDERVECKIEEIFKSEFCETPIDVLVAPDGQILGTSMKYEFEEKPHRTTKHKRFVATVKRKMRRRVS